MLGYKRGIKKNKVPNRCIVKDIPGEERGGILGEKMYIGGVSKTWEMCYSLGAQPRTKKG